MTLKSFNLTLLGRTVFLATAEILANAICWIAAGIVFNRNQDTRPTLALALLAWTLGLRHALDADHISAIDNATRQLISLGQLPVTCGLFFSLGHSTIVLVVTTAIAISTNVFQKLQHVGDVGGIVGAAVSGSFLFIVGTANTMILWRILKQRRKEKVARQSGEPVGNAHIDGQPRHNQMLMMRILGPIVKFVDRPWKMYPVGVLFGFGFDTASSIALLAISAIAKKGPDGKSIPSAQTILLPLLFTAGMSMIDSADSILMLYSYTGFPEKSWAIFERRGNTSGFDGERKLEHEGAINASPHPLKDDSDPHDATVSAKDRIEKETEVKMNVMSSLSIVLTLMSILVAYTISIIVIMGLIGDQCRQCRASAEAEGGGGLGGSWWRAWARANDNSGYIGVAIVGVFILIVGGWYSYWWAARKLKAARQELENPQ